MAQSLREIGQLLALEPGERHRARAYDRGARAIEALAGDLRQLAAAGRLRTVPGIGARLARTIEELLDSGSSGLLERLRRRYPPGVLELSAVLSVPRVRALHDALGISSLAELRDACAAGLVRTVRGFGAATERRVAEAIERHAARAGAVLLPEAAAQAAGFLAYLRVAGIRAELAGALRRRVETVSRLDVVVASADPAAVITQAAAFPGAAAVLEHGDHEAMLHPANGLPIHVRAVPPASFAAAWLCATGSAGHVDALVRRGLAAGVSLHANGMERSGKPVALADEAAAYRTLGLAFVPPELREDAGEVDAAATGTLPDDLIESADIQGAVHCHTVYSDGRNSIEEMARAAEALGMRYLTITDHSPTAHYAGGLTVDRLRRQREEIARVQERVGVSLLCGTESDILRDGALDFPDTVLRELDVVIASIHSRYALDEQAMTRRLVRALHHPVFKIWGHALGRYILTRPPFACDIERVLDAAADSRTAVEINGDPHRLDLEPRWIREARRRGIRFVVSSDAHSVSGLENFRWGVDMARRGWVSRGEVLNTLPPAEFRNAVRP